MIARPAACQIKGIGACRRSLKGLRVNRKFVRISLSLAAFHSLTLFGLSTPLAHPQRSFWELPERRVSAPLARSSQFSDVPHAGVPARCEDVEPPQALTTPNPLQASTTDSSRVKVSFIIGTDGRVHSPLILESAGLAGDRSVLRAVRIWRFRPATCNGVPTEIEGKIEFSSR
jgi:TonB family protein